MNLFHEPVAGKRISASGRRKQAECRGKLSGRGAGHADIAAGFTSEIFHGIVVQEKSIVPQADPRDVYGFPGWKWVEVGVDILRCEQARNIYPAAEELI